MNGTLLRVALIWYILQPMHCRKDIWQEAISSTFLLAVWKNSVNYTVDKVRACIHCRHAFIVVSFPDPTNPSADRFQYCMRGGCGDFVMFLCSLQEFVQSQ